MCTWEGDADGDCLCSTGASRVLVFDHKVRRGPAYWHKLGRSNAASRGPLQRAHVDQSYNGAVLRLRELFPEETDQIMASKRWQIINVSLLLTELTLA
jgi:hypothetical protein